MYLRKITAGLGLQLFYLVAALPALAAQAPGVSGEPASSYLGALFTGRPAAGFGVADLAVIALGIYLILKVTAFRKRPGDPSAGSGPDNSAEPKPQGPKEQVTVKKQAESAWAALRSAPPQEDSVVRDVSGPKPEGFDQADFLDGARLLYSRMQTAWAARRLEEIRPFATEAMMKSIEAEAKRDHTPREVSVVLVEGAFAGVETEEGEERAKVLFKALLREGEAAPSEVRELWHFVRGQETGGMWRLDAIEGVEDA